MFDLLSFSLTTMNTTPNATQPQSHCYSRKIRFANFLFHLEWCFRFSTFGTYVDVGKTSWWHLFFLFLCYNCISGSQYILMANSRQISLWYLLVFCINHICIFVARYHIVANVGQTSWWHFCQEGKCNNQLKENKRRNHKVSRTQQNRKKKMSVRKKDEIIFLEFCGSDHWNKCM